MTRTIYRLRQYKWCGGVQMQFDALGQGLTLEEAERALEGKLGEWAVVELTYKLTPNGNVRKGSRKETIIKRKSV